MKENIVSNYNEKLENLQKYLNNSGSKSCTEILRTQIEEAKSQLSEESGDELLRNLSKDLSRYHDSFMKFLKTMEEMGGSDNLKYLRKKLIGGEGNFFEDTWGEPSDGFFRTKKFIGSNLKDLSLAYKINSTLDNLRTGLKRYVGSRYSR